MKTKILIVEDDPSIRFGLVTLFKSEGFSVEECAKGDEAVASVTAFQPEVILLDVMLPGLSGYDICKTLRNRKVTTPILMLTAKGQEMDKVIGLDLGADDYVTKPFGARELLARVQALLRRQAKAAVPCSEPFTLGRCMVDPKTYTLQHGKETESLTPKELQLLQVFHAHPGEVLSRDFLLNAVWGVQYYGTTRALDQMVAQLRKKLGDAGDKPTVLLTVHGVGYRLVES
jgi:DNA-binding response OmpR family regulator